MNMKKVKLDKYNVIGDIHGCYGTFVELLVKLGYSIDYNNKLITNMKKQGTLILVGDIVDKGEDSIKVLELVMNTHKR